jgi:hypothetical protein
MGSSTHESNTEKDFVEVRQKVGLLFQNADDQLLCPTVLEDVAFGPFNQGKPPVGAIRIRPGIASRGWGSRVSKTVRPINSPGEEEARFPGHGHSIFREFIPMEHLGGECDEKCKLSVHSAALVGSGGAEAGLCKRTARAGEGRGPG